jgi:hypothetical protein
MAFPLVIVRERGDEMEVFRVTGARFQGGDLYIQLPIRAFSGSLSGIGFRFIEETWMKLPRKQADSLHLLTW